jgi:hypothetical protein
VLTGSFDLVATTYKLWATGTWSSDRHQLLRPRAHSPLSGAKASGIGRVVGPE